MTEPTRPSRPVSWVRAAYKDFGEFPEEARSICLTALTIAAEGGKAGCREADERQWVPAYSNCVALSG